jgi:ABC-type proline/glycine betaine transport system ATPase subunit
VTDTISVRGNDRSGNALIVVERIGNRIEITIDGVKVNIGQARQAVTSAHNALLESYAAGMTEADFSTGVYIEPPPQPPLVVDAEWETVKRG